MSEMETKGSNSRPMTGIEFPEENDVPMGRGGFVNAHVGHRRYIKMVQDRQLEYVQCKKVDKMEVSSIKEWMELTFQQMYLNVILLHSRQIAWDIIRKLRAMDPPARFLRKDPATGLWNDVGDQKFREKVSQALREHQPFIKGVSEWDDADLEPLPVGEAVGEDLSWNENQAEQSRMSENCENFQRPAVLASADKRRAFLATRNEVTVTNDDVLFLPPDDARFNLSEFSVSHGPSFTDFGSRSEMRRNSSGLGNILDAVDNMDVLNESNAYLSVTEEDNYHQNSDRMDDRCDFMANRAVLERPPLAIPERISPSPVKAPESDFTFPPFKRCTLSRDKSEVSKILKEIHWTISPLDAPIEFGGEDQVMESSLSALSGAMLPLPDQSL